MPKWTKILRGKKVKAGVEKKAETVQEYWKGLVSPSEGVFDPGNPAKEHMAAPEYGGIADYQNSITITDMSDENGPRERVQAHDFKAKWIEFGTAHMPAYAPLAKVKARFRK